MRLNFLVNGYNQIAIIFPFVVAAPRFFAGSLTLGGLTRTSDAFSQVQIALSWFVNSYNGTTGANLALWRAEVERLVTFQNAIYAAHQAIEHGPELTDGGGEAIRLRDVTLALPDGRI